MLGLTLVTAITVTVVASPGPVAADQVSDLKAQAAQIAQDLVLEQLQIGTDQQQYDVDRAKVQRDEAEIGSTQNQIQSDVLRVTRDRKRLQDEAVSAYVNIDPSGGILFEGNQSDTFARAEYEDVTSGDTELTIDALHTDEDGLHAERATLQQQEAQDQATTEQQATQASAARQTQVELNSKQSEITGQLVAAVAQQQAVQAAAAAKAVQAAQAEATAAAAATSTTSASASGDPSSTSQGAPSGASGAAQGTAGSTSSGDPVLPPFLQCVLRVESGGNYGAVSPGGTYMGGFQFSQPTWNEAAQLAGLPQLINVPPNQATPAQQDDLAIALYQADGQQPWDDSCRNS
jgi:peptidoglycan hydrolase CwlO-like protein